MASWKKVIVSGSAAELASLSLTTALTVPSGGTGVSTLTSGGILYGNGTGAIQATSVLANGQLLIGDGSGVPTLATLTAGEGIDITNGAGSITIIGEDASTTNKGIVELATTAEVTAGTDTTRAVTPDALNDGYFGTTNVTTLGTIATGTWQGSVIQNAYIAENLTISGGTINNTVIGGVTPAAGTFTSGSFVGITLTNNGTISGAGSNIILTGANSSLSGSFSGSFFGDGTGITGVNAAFPITIGSVAPTLKYFVNNGAQNQQVDQTAIGTYMAGAGLTSTNGILAVGAGTGITVNANDVAVNYGSTSGTAVQGNTTITVNGTANEIEITGTAAQALGGGPSYTIGLPNDVTIGNDLTVSGDLGVTGNAVFNNNIIVRGTASFENTTNLEIADRFILLASGSTADGDGGIVIQTAADKTGVTFAWDGATSDRWGIATGFHASASAYTPEAYMAAVIDIDAGQADTAAYQKTGNIKVDAGEIYIYS